MCMAVVYVSFLQDIRALDAGTDDMPPSFFWSFRAAVHRPLCTENE